MGHLMELCCYSSQLAAKNIVVDHARVLSQKSEAEITASKDILKNAFRNQLLFAFKPIQIVSRRDVYECVSFESYIRIFVSRKIQTMGAS